MVERSEDHPEKWFSVKRRWQADLRRQIFLSWRYGYSAPNGTIVFIAQCT
ncbi:hypothetical protein T01_266 [Trichinella spiralis]|uniref:Uncharacterized protein n=1 Tax=Trichinella spiralis TaxID=6334 RepID=A0A0V1BUZ4_TRISP|nr:hypothetical protein T01_266 [Trichinella spiralis]